MIHPKLIDPGSIAIIGGSQNRTKPGGKIIENLLQSHFSGQLFVVNPKAEEVQGIRSYQSIAEAPVPELAILAIPARFCPEAVKELCIKGTRAFIVISAGFGELDEEGKEYDRRILDIITNYDASLLGPNCIGMIHENHQSVFTTPVPKLDPKGVEFISSSGSTAVFVMEAGMELGLSFSNVYTVGNALQIRVEDILEYLDLSFEPDKSSRIKMIYIENVDDPKKFIRHSRSLISKGARIIALKAGTTEAGSRAASSHTGAMASPLVAVEAMFKKAGVFQCFSRQEMLYAAAILLTGLPEGKNIAVVTHAGGAGVMLTDALEKGGLSVPEIKGAKADVLLEQLYPGSSVSNPIDFLATGTAEQLGLIIDYCINEFEHIDAIAVIFGSPGLFDVTEVYHLLEDKIKKGGKPIYPILPSPVNTKDAMDDFVNRGNLFFHDESIFGDVLAKLLSSKILPSDPDQVHEIDKESIRNIVNIALEGYLPPDQVAALLRAAGLDMINENYVHKFEHLVERSDELQYPVVMKVIGPVHKSDLGGVRLNIKNKKEAAETFRELMKIKDASGILIQPMIKGKEIYIGAKREAGFGHLILFGMGGIFLEVLKDVSAILSPVNRSEIVYETAKLKSFSILKGIRGQKGIHLEKFYESIENISQLLQIAPEIFEMDLNPLMASDKEIVVVDARIHIKKI